MKLSHSSSNNSLKKPRDSCKQQKAHTESVPQMIKVEPIPLTKQASLDKANSPNLQQDSVRTLKLRRSNTVLVSDAEATMDDYQNTASLF